MVKLKDCIIKVKTAGSHVPVLFRWKSTWFPIENILDCWKDTGSWWKGEKEKTFYRVASGKQVFELYIEKDTPEWHLYSIYD